MHLESRQIESSRGLELYLAATPDLAQDPVQEARRMFAAAQDAAASRGGRVCRQRVFVPEGWDEACRQAWQAIVGSVAMNSGD